MLYVFTALYVNPDRICALVLPKTCPDKNGKVKEPWQISIPGGKPPVQPWPTWDVN